MAMSILGHKLNGLFIGSAIAFTTILSVPQVSFANTHTYASLGLSDAAFMIKVERKMQKILQGYGKPFNELVDCLVDLKIAIEDYYNISISQDTIMANLRAEFQKNNVTYNKQDMDSFSSRMKNREKQARKKWRFFSMSVGVPDFQRSDYDIGHINEFYKEYRRNADGKQVEEEEIALPAAFVFDVTATLCGIFLYVIPIPGCREMGKGAIGLGMGYVLQSLCQKMDENEKEERERRKQEPIKQ